jgi:hypothetical protein
MMVVFTCVIAMFLAFSVFIRLACFKIASSLNLINQLLKKITFVLCYWYTGTHHQPRACRSRKVTPEVIHYVRD